MNTWPIWAQVHFVQVFLRLQDLRLQDLLDLNHRHLGHQPHSHDPIDLRHFTYDIPAVHSSTPGTPPRSFQAAPASFPATPHWTPPTSADPHTSYINQSYPQQIQTPLQQPIQPTSPTSLIHSAERTLPSQNNCTGQFSNPLLVDSWRRPRRSSEIHVLLIRQVSLKAPTFVSFNHWLTRNSFHPIQYEDTILNPGDEDRDPNSTTFSSTNRT